MKALLLVMALLPGPVESLDRTVRERIQAIRTPEGSRVFQGISDAGRPVTVGSSLLLIALLDRVSGPATAVRALAVLAPTNAVVEITKRSTQRRRPDGSHKRSNSAFPSSHAANAAALASLLARRWRRLAPAFITFALLVAASRMYLDRHWLSDVIVGLLVGAACDALVARRWPGPGWPGRAGRAQATPDPGSGPSGAG